MRAGRLDRLITLQRKSVTQDDAGQEVEAWTDIVARIAASYGPVRAEERFTAQQFIARQQVDFRIRWSSAVSALNPLDRLLYPAPEVDASPPDEPSPHEIYDIIEVSEIGRREGLKIIAARRAEIAS